MANQNLALDKWTVITKDRKLSAQWEHTIDGYMETAVKFYQASRRRFEFFPVKNMNKS